jgi:hypothetical protein
MRSVVLFVGMIAAVAAPSAAFAAKKGKVPVRPAVVSSTPANLNALSAKVVADAIHQIFVPIEVTFVDQSHKIGRLRAPVFFLWRV